MQAPNQGGTIPGTASPAFTMFQSEGSPLPVLVAAPHGGREYTPAIVERMRDPQFAALRLEDRHVDHLARAVAAATGAALLVAHAPRAMIDLNRSPDDMDWSMVVEGPPAGTRTRHSLANRRARGGLGLVPRRLQGLGEIWKGRLTAADLGKRIDEIHTPYHAALAGALETLRDRWGAALLIDLHSMPPLKARADGGADGPADEGAGSRFVIGDRFGASCDRSIATAAIDYFARHGRPAAHNRPYAGGYVLDRHGKPARGIHALQIEVCRTTYLDARLAEPSGRFAGVARLLSGLVSDLAEEVARRGNDRLPLAAE
ncbi:N-formylglutamate amidohydrolase [Tsuneonella amylolytica]|uniref:N-formylglutamate amidohydrolase n=1 Tax=Tsuneonella amylolytica TaxID=2338327 RepID=UPI001F3EC060|nr:N-formylglutamate amidohydrolase [Tsuneonella amylolytica]